MGLVFTNFQADNYGTSSGDVAGNCVYNWTGGEISQYKMSVRRRQTTGWKFSTRPTLPDARPRNRLGQSGRHRKKGHETYARFYRGMEHYLHMYQSMSITRSRLQSSTRLLAATKPRASPNQLNNFNVSAESHTRQPPPPTPVSNVYVCMTSALPPLFTLIGVLPSYNNLPSTH